jgi:phosphoglycerate dehydrogenase-like enzyme
MTSKPRILNIVRPNDYDLLFTPEARRALSELGEVTYRGQQERMSPEELAAMIGGYDWLLGGWGTPRFTDEVLAAAGALKLYAHSAGSVKGILPPAVFDQGITVTHGARAIAHAVADMCVCLIWQMLRQTHKMDAALKSGASWNEAKNAGIGTPAGIGHEFIGQRIGVLGAGHTGRTFIRLIRRLDCEVWVYDPYLSEEAAAALGAHKRGLDEVLSQCPIVSCQLPTTDETARMIGARELALLQDGAIFCNTARSAVIDMDALLAELQSGRFQAALDVFDQEPLPEDSPFRELDNAILTPHVAGATIEARQRQGQFMVDEMRRFLAGEPLLYQVTKEMLAIMA